MYLTPWGRRDGGSEFKEPERRIELELSFGHRLDLLTEALEGLLQFVPELSLGLFGREVVSVVHVLVLAQVRRDLTDLGVELPSERKNKA